MGRLSTKCACAKHNTWHHGEVSADNLHVEMMFASVTMTLLKTKTGREKFAWHAEEKLFSKESVASLR